MASLLLNPDTWDLMVDAANNIAKVEAPYTLGQDMACACRLFQGELYYDNTQGVPYFNILGQFPPLQFVKNAYVQAALTVVGIVKAVCFIASLVDRQMTGQVQGTDINGNVIPVTVSG
jgi:hypothetical protein